MAWLLYCPLYSYSELQDLCDKILVPVVCELSLSLELDSFDNIKPKNLNTDFWRRIKVQKESFVFLQNRQRAGQFYWVVLVLRSVPRFLLGAAMNAVIAKKCWQHFSASTAGGKMLPWGPEISFHIYILPAPSSFRWCKLGLKNIFVLLVEFKSQTWIPTSKLSMSWHWYPWSTLIIWISAWNIQI